MKQLNIYVLAYETSCDDTCVAIVRGDGLVMADIVIPQDDIHQEYGGVFPKLAMESHKDNIEKALEIVLKKSKLKLEDITAIAVTIGPGLAICLHVGMTKAIELSHAYQIPLITTHHLESHLMVTKLPNQKTLVTVSYTHLRAHET